MKKWWIIGSIVALPILAFAYYTVSPIFIRIEANDALPQEQEQTSLAPERSSKVIGTTGHPASGTVRVVEADGKAYVRYENFKTLNGPDIYVYLAKDLDAKEFVNLGRVKATEGNINYEVPVEIDVTDYAYVLTWCKAFGVLFNYADIRS